MRVQSFQNMSRQKKPHSEQTGSHPRINGFSLFQCNNMLSYQRKTGLICHSITQTEGQNMTQTAHQELTTGILHNGHIKDNSINVRGAFKRAIFHSFLPFNLSYRSKLYISKSFTQIQLVASLVSGYQDNENNGNNQFLLTEEKMILQHQYKMFIRNHSQFISIPLLLMIVVGQSNWN